MDNSSVHVNATLIDASTVQFTPARYIYMAFLVLDVVLNLTLNAFSLIVLCHVASIQATTKVFLRSLTVSDLGIALLYVLPLLVQQFVPAWRDQRGSCYFEIICGTVLFNVNILSLLLLTADRYASIVHCLRYPAAMTVAKARWLACLPWALATAYTVIYITVAPPTYSEKGRICRYLEETVNFSITMVIILASLLTILALYARIAVIAHGHNRRIAQENQTSWANPVVPLRFRRKSLLTVFLINISLVVTWLPEVIALMIAKTTKKHGALRWTFLIQIASCWLNTIIYYLRHKDFREAAHSILLSCLKK